MRKVGFHGGHTVYELGPVSDAALFFECLRVFVKNKYPDQDWSLLTDRLYRRYLKKEELEDAAKLMEKAKVIFSNLPSSSIEWDENMLTDSEKTWLDSRKEFLGDMFLRFFDLFFKAKESALSFFDEFGVYQPVKITASDMPEFVIEKKRPLEEYNTLRDNEEPFWLR